MNKTSILTIICGLMCMCAQLNAQVNTLYYMENVTARTNLNPAFIPTQKFYIDLPVLSGIAFSFGNNSLTASDIVTKEGTDAVEALQKNGDHTPFLNALKTTTNITSEFRTNVLGFGFKTDRGYFTFGISERYRMGLNVPKTLVDLGINGAPDPLLEKSYKLQKIGCAVTAYLETAFGYAEQIDEDWTVGAKAKILFGQAHADVSFSKLGINVTDQAIDIYGQGTGRFTIPVPVTERNDGLPYIRSEDVTSRSVRRIVGMGMAFDAGAVYSYTKDISLSASLTDIGFIRWNKSNWKARLNANTTFESWDFTVDNSHSGWATQIGDSLRKSYSSGFDDQKGYLSLLTATARIGGEYRLLKNKIALGLLMTKTFGGRYRYGEVLTSVNFRPFYWANASVSYGIVNGNGSTLGLGLNLIGGPLNFYVATDYCPLSYTDNGIPYKSKYINGHVGISLTFRQRNPKPACHCDEGK